MLFLAKLRWQNLLVDVMEPCLHSPVGRFRVLGKIAEFDIARRRSVKTDTRHETGLGPHVSARCARRN